MTNKPSFQNLVEAIQPADQDSLYHGRLTEDWQQGRTGFGGLLSALAVTALRQEIKSERPLRTLMTAFIGPVGAGDFSIGCQELRSGRSVTWAQAQIKQNGAIGTTLTASFGDSRESAISVPSPSRPAAPSPEEAFKFPFIPGLTPNFTQYFEMRWALGQPPMSGSTRSEVGAWIRFRDPARFGEPHIITFMDLLPPAVMQMFKVRRPISSLTWHLEMLDDLSGADAQDGEGWWFFHAHAQATANGYSQQEAVLYTPTGRALAISRQTIAIFG